MITAALFLTATPEVTENPDPVEETTKATEPDAGFTEDGSFVTRDLLYDEHTNKQFITVQTSGGNTFYIIIVLPVSRKRGHRREYMSMPRMLPLKLSRRQTR